MPQNEPIAPQAEEDVVLDEVDDVAEFTEDVDDPMDFEVDVLLDDIAQMHF